MACQKCGSERVMRVSAKCSDSCSTTLNGKEAIDYAPRDSGIGGGDYIRFSHCLECGQIQGTFPVRGPWWEDEENSAEDE